VVGADGITSKKKRRVRPPPPERDPGSPFQKWLSKNGDPGRATSSSRYSTFL
jgi:hypothetical protein